MCGGIDGVGHLKMLTRCLKVHQAQVLDKYTGVQLDE